MCRRPVVAGGPWKIQKKFKSTKNETDAKRYHRDGNHHTGRRGRRIGARRLTWSFARAWPRPAPRGRTGKSVGAAVADVGRQADGDGAAASASSTQTRQRSVGFRKTRPRRPRARSADPQHLQGLLTRAIVAASVIETFQYIAQARVAALMQPVRILFRDRAAANGHTPDEILEWSEELKVFFENHLPVGTEGRLPIGGGR